MKHALVIICLAAVAVAGSPQPDDKAAECLRQCAGRPKDAEGARLLACLARCEHSKAPDGGTP